MSLLIDRGQIVTAICEHLRITVPELSLVKPYQGELDRYSKKTQIKEPTFPAVVNLTTPFALVISKNRQPVKEKGNSLRFKHDISIYIGDSNKHDFNTLDTPYILTLLTRCVDELHGKSLINGAGALQLESDGEYLITTDLFTIYDQQYYQFEIGT